MSRDRHRAGVAAVTGVVTVGALASTGWLAGAAAHDHAQQLADQQAQQAQQAQPQQAQGAATRARAKHRAAKPRAVVLRARPTQTRQSVRYVQGAPAAPVGGGGSVGSPASHPAPHPAPQPAPSSGS